MDGGGERGGRGVWGCEGACVGVKFLGPGYKVDV